MTAPVTNAVQGNPGHAILCASELCGGRERTGEVIGQPNGRWRAYDSLGGSLGTFRKRSDAAAAVSVAYRQRHGGKGRR